MVPPAARPAELRALHPAALFRNDCLAIADAVTVGLAAHGRALAAVAAGAPAALADAAARARGAGDAALATRVAADAADLAACLDDARGFTRLDDPGRAAAAARAVGTAAAGLARAGAALRSTLAPRERFAVAAALLDAIADKAAADLLSLTHISAGEADALPPLLAPISVDGPSAALGLLDAGAALTRPRSAGPPPGDVGTPPPPPELVAAVEAAAPRLAMLRVS